MKGFYQRRSDGQMADMPPCGLCLHKNKATYQSPCYNCIDIVDLCLHRPNAKPSLRTSFLQRGWKRYD